MAVLKGIYVFFAVLVVWLVSMFPFQARATALDKEVIGSVEEVVLLPWNIRLLGRVDTGASTSSLDARGLTVSNHMAVFKVPTHGEEAELKLPLVGRDRIRHADGAEFRPFVKIEICIGSHRISTKVNLNDRSKVGFPFLIGRNVLTGRFLVDVSRKRVLKPNCR